MTYNAIIVEDEEYFSDLLHQLIQHNCPEIGISGTANSPAIAAEMIPTLKPDLVFMDIEMPGMNAFELINSMPYQKFDIIFTTAHGHYALQAFDHNSVSYLLKPITKEKLKSAILKFLQKKQDQRQPFIGDILKIIRELDNSDKKIKLPRINGFTLIELNEIIRLEADGRYTKVVIMERKPLSDKQKTELICLNIKEFEDKINCNYFFRCHHSHLVNLKKVKHYIKGQGGLLGMENGESVPVSKSKKDDLLKRLNEI